MKAMSKFSFKHFESEELPELFATLKRVFDKADVPFYLIGARARDVWFLPEKSIRITKDIDWSVASEEDAVFQEIKLQLIKNEDFISQPAERNHYIELWEKGIPFETLYQKYKKKGLFINQLVFEIILSDKEKKNICNYEYIFPMAEIGEP